MNMMIRFKTSVLILSLSLLWQPAMAQQTEEESNNVAFWGAMIGALLGAFIGDDNQSQAINAAIGAAIGASTGLLLDKDNHLEQQVVESDSKRVDRILREIALLKEERQYIERAEQSLVLLRNELEISQQRYFYYKQENNFNELLQWQVRIAKLKQEKYELESTLEKFSIQGTEEWN